MKHPYDFAKPVQNDHNLDIQKGIKLLNKIKSFMSPPQTINAEKIGEEDSNLSIEQKKSPIKESGIKHGYCFQHDLPQNPSTPSHLDRQSKSSQDIRSIDLSRSHLESRISRAQEEEKKEPPRDPVREEPSTPSFSNPSVAKSSSGTNLTPLTEENSRAGCYFGGPRALSSRVFLRADHDAMSDVSFPTSSEGGDNDEAENNGN